MQIRFKKSVEKIIEYNPKNEDLTDFLVFVDTNVKDLNISNELLDYQIQSTFLSKCKDFLCKYEGKFQEIQTIKSQINQFETSLNKIDKMNTNQQFSTRSISNKIKTFEEINLENSQKQVVLEQIILNSQLQQNQLELLINDRWDINEDFFEAYNNLEKIQTLRKDLEIFQNENENYSGQLQQSLLKNLNEVKNIALGKLIKYINQKLDTLDETILKQAIPILLSNSEFFQKFLKNFLKWRKLVNKNYLAPTINNFVLIYDKEYIKFFTDVLSSLLKHVQFEHSYLENLFQQNDAAENMSMLMQIFDELIKLLENKAEKIIQNEFDFNNIYQIYKILEKNLIKLKDAQKKKINNNNNKIIQGYEYLLIELIKKLKVQCKVAFKRNIQNFESKLQATKFNIKLSQSYNIIKEYLEKIRSILNSFSEIQQEPKSSDDLEDDTKKAFSSLQFLLQPVLQLAKHKLSKNYKASTSIIFTINVFSMIIKTFENEQSYQEIIQSVTQQLNDCIIQLIINQKAKIELIIKINKYVNIVSKQKKILVNEFQCKVVTENEVIQSSQPTESMQEKHLKNMLNQILEFINLLFHKENYKIVLHDMNLIFDKATYNRIKYELISYFISLYKYLFKELQESYTKLSQKSLSNGQDIEKLFEEFAQEKVVDLEVIIPDELQELFEKF